MEIVERAPVILTAFVPCYLWKCCPESFAVVKVDLVNLPTTRDAFRWKKAARWENNFVLISNKSSKSILRLQPKSLAART
jgi:hypothetical protein